MNERKDPWVPTEWTEAQKRRAARLVKAGRSPKEVARVYETSAKMVQRWARRYGS